MIRKKVRVGSVSYLNSRPLIFGFKKGMMNEDIEMIEDHPSAIAQLLMDDKIDLGLVPVAVMPLLKEWHIISNYGIGCNGEVASVCLFSDVPIDKVKTILLDYQSKTSVELLKILLKEYWHIKPELVDASPGYENEIQGATAGLVIGDRALEQRQNSRYRYDLGLAWKELTGLPFVFAAWISNKELAPSFCKKSNDTTRIGLDHLEIIVAENPYPFFNLQEYYTDFIKFNIDLKMHEAIALFLSKIKNA